MSIAILHLSDIHIKTANDKILKHADHIAACMYKHAANISHIFIVISGDIAYSGTQEQYLLAKDFLAKAKENLEKELCVPVNIIAAPGNHDCDFSKEVSTRKLIINSLDGPNTPTIDASVIEACTNVQSNFFSFRNQIEDGSHEDDGLWRTTQFEIDGKSIQFDAINVSWTSKLNEEVGKLYFPVDRYKNKSKNDADLKILVMHHPLNWFSQSMYRPFRSLLRKSSDIIISGHEHHGNVGIIQDAESNQSAYIEGCVLQGKHDLSDSSFNIAIINLKQGQFSSTRHTYAAAKDSYFPSEEGSWSDYHNLPEKQSSILPISDDFQSALDDPGAYFKHPNAGSLTLGDMFIYPDMRKVKNGDGKQRKYISTSRLLSPEMIGSGIILEGEEKSGRTSLFYQLFSEYHARAFFPLIINGREIRRINVSDMEGLIRTAVDKQYGKSSIETFNQQPPSKKLLLLDDFDECPVKAEKDRADVLCKLKKLFGLLVISVGETFELQELLGSSEENALSSLDHYKLQQFGYSKRAELIERWFTLGSDGTLDDRTLISKCDEAEKVMSMVMTKSVVPSTPLYLVTLLSSIDAGRSGEFKESSLGYYYQYLLTDAFQESGVNKDELTAAFQYVSHLAWEFHAKGVKELSDSDLRAFNKRFTDTWHTVEFSKQMRMLMSARILSKNGDQYSFRYPYIYYYLKGKYLNQNASNPEVRTYIEHCCQHLYVREHANTVLFLAHHSAGSSVIDSISSSLKRIFHELPPVHFNGDTKQIVALINSAPKLTYSGGDPAAHRKRKREKQDEFETEKDGLADEEETKKELSDFAQMAMLMKIIEILGQVLKNQYSTIQRAKKSELIEELFNGPLRALRKFYDYFTSNPDVVAAQIEAAIERRGNISNEEDRKELSKKVVGGLLQLVTVGFLLRTSQAVSSEHLKEDIHTVVSNNDSRAFELIEIGILLDSPKPLPRAKLEELKKKSSGDVIVMRLMHILILNRLYMFKTTENDMQWLSDKLKMDISRQHAITYQQQAVRRVK